MKTVLLTGASSGIGLAITRALLARGKERLVLTARPSSLERFAELGIEESERVHLRPLDVRDSGARERLCTEIEQKWEGVDILINNAGICFRSVLEHMSEEDEQLQLSTNYSAPIELVKLVLPYMRKNKSGQIINISSVGGMMAMPTMGSYSASKFALEGATEALWYEMRPWKVKVSLLEPGFIHSNSFKNVYWSSAAKNAFENDQAYSCYYRNMTSFVEKLMRFAFATPDSVAAKVIATMDSDNPRLRIAATLDARFFALLRRLLPRRFYHWFLYVNLPGIDTWKTEFEN